jgi:sirohydrochlorin cobaltochelatase
MAKRALILFAHGARDPRWAEPFRRLQQLTQAQAPDVAVTLAFLELMAPRLPEAATRLVQEGCEEVTVVPIFFGQGGHVLRDLPVLIEQLKSEFPQVKFNAVDAVGESPEVLNAIAGYCLNSLR